MTSSTGKDDGIKKTKTITIDLSSIKNQRTILVYATDKQIEMMRGIVPQLQEYPNKIKRVDGDIYELKLWSIKVAAPSIIFELGVDDLQGDGYKMEEMLDFEGSAEFYTKAKSDKGFKIISDEYSNERNTELYKGFQKIEQSWRSMVVKDSRTRQLLEDKTWRPKEPRKGRDHTISQFELSELFEKIFLSPPSVDFLEDYWNNDSDRNMKTAIEMTKLTKMDELRVNLTLEDLNKLRRVRNQCMHFRTITPSEYDEAAKIIARYLKDEQVFKLTASMKDLVDKLLRPTMESFGDIAQRLSDRFKL